MILECFALEGNCINDVWDWIYENWSWGFFIAILSLLFTARALKKTDKSNELAEKSLKLTQRSTDIAESSLIAAQKSIYTSIDIYEQQKKDYEEREKREKDKLVELNIKRVSSIMMIASAEAFNCIKQINFFFNLYHKMKGATKIELVMSPDKYWKQIYIFKSGGDFSCISIPDPSCKLGLRFLLEAAMASSELIPVLSNLNGAIVALNTNVDNITRCAYEGNIIAMQEMVYCMIDGNKRTGNDLVEAIMPNIRGFDLQMSAYNGFKDSINELEENINSRPYVS